MSQMAAAVAAATVVLLALVGPRHAAAAADKPQCLFTGPHISFFGADPYHEQIPAASAATCCYLCAETPKCVAFEFNEHVGGGTCFLKDSTGVVPRALEGAQSGVLIQPGTTISAEAVHANHAATTGTPAAVLGGAAAAGPPAKGAAAQAERAEGAGGAAAAAGSSGGQGAGPDSVPLLGASLSAASGGAPSSGVSGGSAACLEGALSMLPKLQRKSRK